VETPHTPRTTLSHRPTSISVILPQPELSKDGQAASDSAYSRDQESMGTDRPSQIGRYRLGQCESKDRSSFLWHGVVWVAADAQVGVMIGVLTARTLTREATQLTRLRGAISRSCSETGLTDYRASLLSPRSPMNWGYADPLQLDYGCL
jgi:hypothetical protein